MLSDSKRKIRAGAMKTQPCRICGAAVRACNRQRHRDMHLRRGQATPTARDRERLGLDAR